MRLRYRSLTFLILLAFIGSSTGVTTALSPAASKAHPAVVSAAELEPDAFVRAIVQKTDHSDVVARLVGKHGGRIVEELSLINALVVEMPAGRLGDIARADGVRWVSLDAPVEGSTLKPYSALDDFNVPAYDSGSGKWSGAWAEAGENDGPASGKVQLVSGGNFLSYSMRMGGKAENLDGTSLSRKIDLGGAANAAGKVWLTYFYKRELLQYGGGAVAIQVSVDGGNDWQTLKTYALDLGDLFPVLERIDISAYITGSMLIRFAGHGVFDGYFFADSVKISYEQPAYPNFYLTTTGAEILQAKGLTGAGIGVAVVDSGIADHSDIQGRLAAAPFGEQDVSGHGTFVAGIIGGDGHFLHGAYRGMASGVNLLSLKVTNEQGMAYESDVIAALQWIYENKDAYNIRIVNLALNSTVEDSYHNSPLDAACEILWFNSVVVVVSAGNFDPQAGFNPIRTAPANDPFVIVVGAADEHGTPDPSDDSMAAYSAFGLTLDGTVKPDIIAPGSNIFGLLSAQSDWNIAHPERIAADHYIRLSGTSVSAPVVAGAAALLLQAQPELTPDQVKFRLMNTSANLLTRDGQSIPYLDAAAAVEDSSMSTANTGQTASQLLWSGDNPVSWGSVSWNSVSWNSVSWNSVSWNSVSWNSVSWNSVFWDQ